LYSVYARLNAITVTEEVLVKAPDAKLINMYVSRILFKQQY